MITVERRDPFTGQLNTMNIPMEPATFEVAYTRWMEGTLVQSAFPTLTAEEREFIMTGITPETWNRLFGTGE